MRYQSIALSILLVSFALARALYAFAVGFGTEASQALYSDGAPTDPESLLARGEKIPLSCIDLADIELLPGVSETLANNILLYRTRVIAAHQASLDHRALAEVPGIGEKRSRELYRYLELALTQCS